MNKGLKLRFCKECNRKRFCSKVPIPGHNFRFTCIKGHSWIIEGVTLERISAATEEILISKIKDIFNRDDVFYKHFKK